MATTGTVALADAGGVVLDLVAAINTNRAWLSEIDGAIGDGDHGINMSKGFTRAGETLAATPGSLGHAFTVLGETLLDGIGGSMGPLYGTFFLDMAAVVTPETTLDAALFSRMLRAGLAGIQDLGSAKPGDKTLLDTLAPACDAFDAAVSGGADFAAALAELSRAAEVGRDSTIGMMARIGRAARLGERSRGVLDAGATSCCLILQSLAAGLVGRLG
jgi:dihydroxyacetone kinase phosphoprotein-dependent L subunit